MEVYLNDLFLHDHMINVGFSIYEVMSFIFMRHGKGLIIKLSLIYIYYLR